MKIILYSWYKMLQPVVSILDRYKLNNISWLPLNITMFWAKLLIYRIDLLRKIAMIERDKIDKKLNSMYAIMKRRDANGN